MKKITNRIIVGILSCMLAFLAIAPMTAEAATVTKSQTIYLSGKGLNSYADIYVGDLKPTSKITNFKSSKVAVAKPFSTTYYSDNCTYFEDGYTDTSDNYAYLRVKLLKKGTAKITFKVDGKKKTSTVKVLSYTNPVQTATLTGTINGSKVSQQIASATKDKSVAFYTHSKAIKNAQIALTAKNGWIITSADVLNDGDSIYNTFRNTKGVRKTTINVGTMSDKKATVVFVTYQNKKTKGTIECMYVFNA